MGEVSESDNTMPALFSPTGVSRDDELVPLAQLGAGPDGSAILARRGDRLVEILQLSFGPESLRWPELAARVRALGAVDHPGVRAVLSLDEHPPALALEGDRSPPLVELIEQGSLELGRGLAIVGELARAVAAAHHVGLCHGGLHPWSVHVGAADRPRIELTQLATKPVTHAWVAACAAPELAEAEPDAAADVYALGKLVELFATSAGRTPTPAAIEIIEAATAADPDARPSAVQLARKLGSLAGVAAAMPATMLGGKTTAPPPDRISRPAVGIALGRFELTKRLGAGAMGEVWEARDTTGGPNVAIKLLRAEVAADDELLRRFRKEARVLAKVGSPYIANYIDLNEDRGVHYLVLELVTGGSVHGALRRLGKLPERLALGIVADACRALVEPHRLGIVHRDLKPDNMMFVRAGIELDSAPLGQLVKLGDFGIARLVEETAPGGTQADTSATREGTVLGTPEFMAPEQCQGAKVTAATDVYALGCCLFALIAGRTPFIAGPDDPSQMSVILAHLNVPPPRLDDIHPEASPAVADLVARCLEKAPSRRFADASDLLAALEQLCDGETALVAAHPSPPVFRASRVQTYDLSWELRSSPEALWPYVSNTEKMNRATGLAPVHFEIETIGSQRGSRATGSQRVAGVALKWREHPYEWIEGTRHVVLRVFDKGVLRWYVADVQLERLANGGTRLRNTIRLEPRGSLARILSKWEIGVKYKRALDRVYRRLDGILASGSSGAHPEIDPIEPEVTISEAVRARVTELGDIIIADGGEVAAVEALTQYVLHRGDQDVARIRPLELAKRFRIPEDAMIDAALRAAKHGLLVMVWDVICPSCRIPSNVIESLAKIEQHARCKACNISYDVDFSRAIELAFRASPEIRSVETRTFCIGGPAHFPHVAAQVRLAPNERLALSLALSAGFYLVRSPQLVRVHELRVVPSGGVRRIDIALGEAGELGALTAGDQLVALANPTDRELLVRIERAGDRAFALTAARVISIAAFRELFPDQSLAPGRLMAVTQASLVVAQLDASADLFRELGDEKAFPVAARFFEQIGALAKELGGSLVKTFGGLAIAAFERPGPAVEAALRVQALADADPVTHGLGVRVAVHRGPLMAMSHAGRLDYFGQNLETALDVVATTEPMTVSLTSAVCFDPGVAERVKASSDQLGMQARGDGAWVLSLRAPRADVRALPAAGDSIQTKITPSR